MKHRPRRPPGTPNYREKWKGAVAKTPTLPTSTRLFLVVALVPDMDSTGRVSVPAEKLARRMDCDKRTVARHIAKARDEGWLTVAQPGHRGMTAVYRATFPEPESMTTVVTLSTVQKGDRNRHPKWVTGLSPFSARGAVDNRIKGDTWCHPKKVLTYVSTCPATAGDYARIGATAPSASTTDAWMTRSGTGAGSRSQARSARTSHHPLILIASSATTRLNGVGA